MRLDIHIVGEKQLYAVRVFVLCVFFGLGAVISVPPQNKETDLVWGISVVCNELHLYRFGLAIVLGTLTPASPPLNTQFGFVFIFSLFFIKLTEKFRLELGTYLQVHQVRSDLFGAASTFKRLDAILKNNLIYLSSVIAPAHWLRRYFN